MLINISHVGDDISENTTSSDESVDDDDKDKDYQPFSSVIQELSSNESNSQFPDQAQNTCKYEYFKNCFVILFFN